MLFPKAQQELVNCATNVRIRDVEVLTVYLDLQPVPFNKGFYSVDMTFFFDVSLDLFRAPASGPVAVHGISIFSKKVILYGSEGNVKMFTSDGSDEEIDNTGCKVLPKATVQVAQPIALSARICDANRCCCEPCCRIPECICKRYGGEFETGNCGGSSMPPSGCLSSSRLSAMCRCSFPPMTSVCRKKSAKALPITPVNCSGALSSPPTSFSRPKPETVDAVSAAEPFEKPKSSLNAKKSGPVTTGPDIFLGRF